MTKKFLNKIYKKYKEENCIKNNKNCTFLTQQK